jgi:hypothetical protein
MSDFDDVLERLLSDPAFKSRLAADPASALAGYRLTADELDLLQAQVAVDGGGQSRVEQRTSKASMFGLFSSLGAGIGDVVHGHGQGHGLGDAISGAGQQAEHGLDQPAGGRHAALDPQESRPTGLARHISDFESSQGGRHSAGLGDAQAEAGPGGAYASAGPTEAAAGHGTLAEAQPAYGQAGFEDAQPAYGQAGLEDAQPGYGQAGFGDTQSQPIYGQTGLAESQQDHASSQGTVYRSSTYSSTSSSSSFAEGGPGGTTPHAPQSDAHGLGGLIGQSRLAPEEPPLADQRGPSGAVGLGGLLGQSHLTPDQGADRHGLDGLVGRDLNPQGQAPTDGYHTRVDWDGDGKWDQHTYVDRPDGGVDIIVDTDGDGKAEFIGHDTDRDGLINSSEIDTNHDGVTDARYEDLNGDGWLDKRTR